MAVFLFGICVWAYYIVSLLSRLLDLHLLSYICSLTMYGETLVGKH